MCREEYKERTRLELACYIGNAYFSQVTALGNCSLNITTLLSTIVQLYSVHLTPTPSQFHLVSGSSKSPLSLHCPEQGKADRYCTLIVVENTSHNGAPYFSEAPY